MLKLLMSTEAVGAPRVELFETNFGYAVRYGLQVSNHDALGDALTEFAACVHHAMTCSGLLDTDE